PCRHCPSGDQRMQPPHQHLTAETLSQLGEHPRCTHPLTARIHVGQCATQGLCSLNLLPRAIHACRFPQQWTRYSCSLPRPARPKRMHTPHRRLRRPRLLPIVVPSRIPSIEQRELAHSHAVTVTTRTDTTPGNAHKLHV